jgi:hypothetical protein
MEKNTLTPLQKAATSRKLIEAEILARAWTDEAFRGKLEADPAAALAEAGFPSPEGRTVQVIPETPGALTLVIPPAPAFSAEASDAELESVAGGGLVQNGKCELYEEGKKGSPNDASGFGAGIKLGLGAAFGASWLWG